MNRVADPLDRQVIGTYLRERVSGFGQLREVQRFRQGQSNPTYLLVADGGRYVLRTQPPGELLPSAHQVAREYRVMRALASTPVPVPGVHLLSAAEDSPLGRDFFLMEYVSGEIYWDPALPALDLATRRTLYDQQNAVLAALHSVDVDAVGLGDFGKRGDYYGRQIRRWTRQYRASELEPIPAMDRLITWLDAHQPADDGQVCLVHGDYRLDNLIVRHGLHRNGGGAEAGRQRRGEHACPAARIVAVLDWELSTLGHPYADLAYQCMQWRLPNTEATRGLAGVPRTELGIPTEEEYVAQYCARTGRDGIDGWPFYLAFSFFRLAAIVQGVVRRAVEGNAANPDQVERFRAMVPSLAAMANEVTLER